MKQTPSLSKVLCAFTLFFGTLFFLPLIFAQASFKTATMWSLLSYILVTILLLFFYRLRFSIYVYMYGVFSWLIAFPLATITSETIAFLMKKTYGYTDASQTIAQQILALKSYPLLFILVTFITVFCVPLAEEILFRGLLQKYLMSRLPKVAAILITAFIFAFAHFNPYQGLGNVQILSALFVLSLILSYIFNRWASLMAPLALHQTFNALSLIGLLIYE